MSHTLLCEFVNDSPDFISGFECGQVWSILESGDELKERPIHNYSMNQVYLMCESFGRNIVFDRWDDTWTTISTNSKLLIP